VDYVLSVLKASTLLQLELRTRVQTVLLASTKALLARLSAQAAPLAKFLLLVLRVARSAPLANTAPVYLNVTIVLPGRTPGVA